MEKNDINLELKGWITKIRGLWDQLVGDTGRDDHLCEAIHGLGIDQYSTYDHPVFPCYSNGYYFVWQMTHDTGFCFYFREKDLDTLSKITYYNSKLKKEVRLGKGGAVLKDLWDDGRVFS